MEVGHGWPYLVSEQSTLRLAVMDLLMYDEGFENISKHFRGRLNSHSILL